jgi:Leucine-rich repeat (LRR) protein
MDLRYSQNLIKTPNFTGLPNLERVIFEGCTRLYEVHPSIGVLKRLTLLSLEDCKYLNSLPPEIKLESLETLILSGCSRLKKFPNIGTSMTRLSKLYLDGTAIGELPLSIEHLTGLTLLNLQDCKNLSSFPIVIGSLTSLKTLILSGLKVRPHKPWHSLGLSPILSSIGAAALALWADFSLGLSPILSAIVATTLIGLWTYCLFIAKHPEPKPNFFLLKSLSGLGSLVCLDLSDCNLEDGALPNDLSCLSSLQSLNLSKNHFTCVPDSVSQLSKLKFLYLDNCSRLKSLTNIPLSTQYVMARECTSLENYSNQVIVWTSGESGFTFINCLSLGDNEECNMSDINLESGFTSINCLSFGDDEECQIFDVKLLDVHFQPLWQRYMKVSLSLSLSLSLLYTDTH